MANILDFNTSKYDRTLLIIPSVTAMLFLFESIYSRFLSAILYNSFVFIIISLAVVGYGIGSLYYFLKNERSDKRDFSEISIYKSVAVLFFLIFATLAFIYFMPYFSYWAYLLPVSFPFILTGYLFSLLYDTQTDKSQIIFTLDLAGAVAGLLGGYVVMNLMGVVRTMILVGIITMSYIFFYIYRFGNRKLGFIPAAAAVVLLAAMFSGNAVQIINSNFRGFFDSPFTSLAKIKQSGGDPNIIATRWDAFSRTDVIDLGEGSNTRTVTIDGAANASMVKRTEGDESHLDLKDQIDFLPYVIRNPETVAIVGAGGGRDILQALHGNARDIDAIEINKSSIELTNEFKDYNGSVYLDGKVNVIAEDGRSYIANSQKSYDLIFLSMVMTGVSQAANLVTAETYIYTKEAVSAYMDKLTDEGILTFVSHDLQDMLKLIRTIRDVLIDRGESPEEIRENMAVFGNAMSHGQETMFHNPVILYSPKKFTEGELVSALNFIGDKRAVPLMVNGLQEADIISQVIEKDDPGFSFNVFPATDEKPYFYHLSDSLPLSLKVILVSAVLAILMLWPGKIISYRIGRPSLYFALSGFAFMLVEIVLLQKMTLILGHSMISFVFVVSMVLLGAGIGSLYSSRLSGFAKYSAIIAGMLLLAETGILYYFKDNFLAMPMIMKLLVSGPLILLASFFQGMIFPSAIKSVKQHIPLFYGINSSFALMGSVLAVILIFNFGSTVTMALGASAYLFLFFIKSFSLNPNKGVINGQN